MKVYAKELFFFNKNAELVLLTSEGTKLGVLSIYGDKPFAAESCGSSFAKLAKKSTMICLDVDIEVSPKIFMLTSQNLTELGGPMGTERTWNNWTKYFRVLSEAKMAARKDYKKRTKNKGENLSWRKKEKGKLSTQDLGFVMYHIQRIRVEP